MLSCKACRRHHYKCDGQQPRCGRCIKGDRECVRDAPRRFYNASRVSGDASFSSSQAWIPLPARGPFKFVHVAKEKVAGDEDEQTGANEPPPTSQSIQIEQGWSMLSDGATSLSPPNTSPNTLGQHHSLDATWLPTASDNGSRLPDSHPSAQPTSPTKLPNTQSSDLTGRLYLNPPTWPLEDVEDATLLQHFINEVALFFDFCDKDRHFATIVPQRVRKCGTLLSAVLALSARHLSRVDDFDPAVADRHYDQCLQTLIPALNDSSSVYDETLLIIVVILRLLEELDVPIAGSDSQGHLLGAQSLLRLQEKLGLHSSLRQAVYWACLRQEIYMSLRDRRRIRLDLDLFQQFQAVQPGDRYSFACAATTHCAEVIGFVYGDQDAAEAWLIYKTLTEDNKRIMTHESCQPFYYRARGGDFPDIRYESEDHIIAIQYSTLARIVLDMNDPSTSPNHVRSRDIIRDKVRQHVWTMCGVGLSNTTSPAAILIACMAISLSVDCFDSQGDLERLGGVLDFTEKTRGWPTASIGDLLHQTRSA